MAYRLWDSMILSSYANEELSKYPATPAVSFLSKKEKENLSDFMFLIIY